MTHVTYLFGAGASKNALPLVFEFPERIENCIQILKEEINQLDDTPFTELNISKSKRTLQTEFIDALYWMQSECKNHASVDTFAKKLYLRKDTAELMQLKATLSCYITMEQILNKYDKRYDSFFASILNTSCFDLPSNIKILSWNYDSQIEIAYNAYSDRNHISLNHETLNICTKFTKSKANPDKFGIFKINGTTGYGGSFGVVPNNDSMICELNKAGIEIIINCYGNLKYKKYNSQLLSFAWEDQELKSEENIVGQSIIAVKNTEVLVVIGYSFPFFNREVDRKIIGSMNQLKKVYFQSPEAAALKERFLGIRQDFKSYEVQERYDTGQFLLPVEL